MSQENGSGTTVITARRALVGPSLESLDDPVLTVEAGTIVDISTAASATEARPSTGSEEVPTIDLDDALVLPGFIDAHVHLGFHPTEDILQGGVTTVRDTGAPPDEIFDIAARSRSDMSIPLVLATGPMLTVPGGYPTQAAWAAEGTGLPVTSLDDARAAVRRLKAAGAAFIKVALNPPVGPTLDGSTLGAIVDTAHQLGLRVTGHIHGLEQLDKALDAGVDELAHMLMSTEEIGDRTIERMVEAGMTIVPTLSIRSGKDLRQAIENLSRFRSAGGHVVYGTDLGNAGPEPGIDRTEVKAMSRAGFDPLAIVASATTLAARYLGLDDRGQIAVGMAADIIAVPADALQKAKRLTEVRFVMREGLAAKGP